jgi:hypothetical protein
MRKFLSILFGVILFCGVASTQNLWEIDQSGNIKQGYGTQSIVDLITKGPWIDVRSFMDGQSGRPTFTTWYANQTGTDVGAVITAAIAAVPVDGTLLFSPGTYAYATSPNFAVTGLKIFAIGATLKHTGSGNAFIVDGGAAGSGVSGIQINNVIVEGNSNSTNGGYFRSVHHSLINNFRCKGASTTGSAILLEWCVANQWNTVRATTNEELSPVPLYGMYITRRGSGGDHSTTQIVINPVFEGLAYGTGIYFDYTSTNTVIGGTSESNNYGIQISGNGYGNNKIIGTDLEANTTADILTNTGLGGAYNSFLDLIALGTVSLQSGFNVISGGTIANLTIGNYAANKISNLLVTTSYTNTSAFTHINNVTGPGGTPIPNTIAGIDGVSKQITHANAAPASGTWAVGDIVFNQTPSVGNPAGWMCIVAGTPGTWKAMGNLLP